MLRHTNVPESNEACISNRISIDCAHSSDDHIELLWQLLYQLWLGFQNELSPGQSCDRKPDDAVGAGEVRQERLLSERLTVYYSLGVYAIGFSRQFVFIACFYYSYKIQEAYFKNETPEMEGCVENHTI